MRFARWVTHRPGWVLSAASVVSLLALIQLVDLATGTPRIRIQPSVTSLIPEADAKRVFYDETKETFRNDDALLLALTDEEGIFRTETLDRIARITEVLESHADVERVISLASVDDVQGTEDSLRLVPFLEEIPTASGALAALRGRVLGNPVWAGHLVSRDAGAAAFVVILLPISDRELIARNLDRELLDYARRVPGPGQLSMTGGPHLRAEASRVLNRDLGVVVPLLLLAMALVGLAGFRSLAGAVVPVATLAMALIWCLGVVAWLQLDLNLLTVVLPPLVLIIGFAYAIHIVSATAAMEGAPRERTAAGLGVVGLATLVAGVTTVAGFLALTASPLAAIRVFGLLCALGVVCTVVSALFVAPALLCFVPPRLDRTQGRAFEAGWRWLADFLLARRRAVLFAGAVVAALAVLGAFQIRLGTGLVTDFSPESQVRRDFDRIDTALEGAGTLSVVLRGARAGAFHDPELLTFLTRLQRWLADQPEVGSTTSLADHVRLLHWAFSGERPGTLRIPSDRALVSQLLLLGPTEDLENVVDFEARVAHVLVRARTVDTRVVSSLVARTERWLAAELPQAVDGQVTGSSVLLSETMDQIAAGQATSLSLAFGMIFLVLALLLTSWRAGLVALLPNALPVLLYFGALGFSGSPLNLTTGVVACLVLGIAVDDTTHFMVHFSGAARRWASEAEGVRESLVHVGRPVTFTSVALVVGFLCMLVCDLEPLRQFGALAAFTIGCAWIADITLTPAVASTMRIVTLWDLLAFDLGEDPQRTIPLFANMRPREARLMALMMHTVECDAGDTLLRAGEEGRDTYVVLDGELLARSPSGQGGVPLRSLQRGSVIGEVGLVRGRRSADIVATEDARLLRFGAEEISRLKRRSPRIAAQLLENLALVLADRLVDVSERLAKASPASEPR